MRPRRSVLYVPGSNAKALAKARTLACDGLILDLEDSVAPETKASARGAVAAALAEGGFGRREVLVRVNARGTEWFEADLAALARTAADGLVLPKAESPADVAEAVALLGRAGAREGLPLWLTIETPRGVLAADALAGAHPAVAGLVAGTSDLTKELHARHVPGREPLLYALSAIVLAARAHSLAALDGVHLHLDDEAGFTAACRQGRNLGFDGKTLIHPKQIGPCNQVFTPRSQAVAWSRKIIDAYAAAAARGEGVVLVDGKLVENLHVESARRLVKLAEAIAAMEAANG